MIDWSGVIPALTTKFNRNDSLDLEKFKHSLDTYIKSGINGLIIGGSLGEASTLSTEEKEELVKLSVRDTAEKIPVILNVAEGSTKQAIAQAALAKKWGANGIMLLPPMRYKSDEDETVNFFKEVAA